MEHAPYNDVRSVGLQACYTRRMIKSVPVLLTILLSLILTPLPDGHAQTASGRPARIISIVPAVTEMLFAVGAGGRVVAVGNFDKFPPEVNKLQRVGAL